MLGLFTERQHTISVRSITHTDLYKLPKDKFDKIVQDYPAQGIAIADAATVNLKPVHASLAARRMYGAPRSTVPHAAPRPRLRSPRVSPPASCDACTRAGTSSSACPG